MIGLKSEFDWSVAMRKILLAAVMFGAVSTAHAADLSDLPILRGGFSDGVPSRVNWQGFYVGGQAGYGSSDENFNGSTSNMVAALIANNVYFAALRCKVRRLNLLCWAGPIST